MSVQPAVETETSLESSVALVAAIDQTLAKLSESGTTAPHQACDGEEAVLVGAASAMAPQDWIFWGRQVNAAALIRGMSAEDLISHALHNDGLAGLAERKIVTVTSGPATRLPHAAGLAWAARRDNTAVLCELGDGAVSDGDFHVGVNFACVMDAPVVFIVRSEGDIAVRERDEGYGIRSEVVDGSCADAVASVVSAAADRARNGGGPTLIEARIARGVRTASKGAISAHQSHVAQALANAEKRGG